MVIIDMEAPKKCQWDCPFCDEDGGACLVSDIKTSDTERPKDCPLIPIEPRTVSMELKYDTAVTYKED